MADAEDGWPAFSVELTSTQAAKVSRENLCNAAFQPRSWPLEKDKLKLIDKILLDQFKGWGDV